MEIFHSAGSSFKNKPLAGLMIDGRSSSGPLTDDELMVRAPSAFAEGAHESRSERYAYIPTIKAVQALREEGFMPVAASQGKCRLEGKTAFTKHMIRFCRDRGVDPTSALGIPEIVLINSHDGTSSYWLLEGLFRAVCKNGLIVCDGDVHGVKVTHSGNVVDKVIECSYQVIDNASKAAETSKNWAQIELKPAEQIAFATSAAQLRFDPETQVLDPAQLITVRRPEDTGNDLWTVFNRAQEALIRGGNKYTSRNVNAETGAVSQRRLEARPVRGIDRNVGLNQALWTLGAEMAKLKAA
jgi:hypothetical protein